MAKLLFITQKVDQDDDVLGFVTLWIREFAKHFDSIVVVCLGAGIYELPGNVQVISLGKESGRGRLYRLLKFFQTIWRERGEYDQVFVHMNPIYAVLGGLLWSFNGKKVFLWYTHIRATLKLRVAMMFCDKVFTASDGSFPISSKKVFAIGHGIDTESYRNLGSPKTPNTLLCVGRIAPVKRLEVLIDAVSILKKQNVPAHLTIVGKAAIRDSGYASQLVQKIEDLGLRENVVYMGSRPFHMMPAIYNQHEILLNITPGGSFDKALLEAMACETLVVTSNQLFEDSIPAELLVRDEGAPAVAQAIQRILVLDDAKKVAMGIQLRDVVVKNHSLNRLALLIQQAYIS